MRKLQWHNNLGFVDLTLTFQNGEFQFKCQPIHAILLQYFDEGKYNEAVGVSSLYLSKELKMNHNQVKQKMTFWTHKNVIKEEKDKNKRKNLANYNYEMEEIIYYAVKNYQKSHNDDENVLFEQPQYELISQDASLSNIESSHLNFIIEKIILNILDQTGPKTLDKMHNLLKTVYKTAYGYPYSERQTSELLKQMILRQKVNFNGEIYSSNEI
eukprot:TRINITY_DN12479_c0_g1_i1.p2 TRINITY_DN12479_c0_g1~~TRINITY_DN12479_c0_g1_i1.p2  ORF type:complete len:213 (+),score=31.91 TRINITY_DN12479_c0_g1_i1:1168-1806(+)